MPFVIQVVVKPLCFGDPEILSGSIMGIKSCIANIVQHESIEMDLETGKIW
jgi:hypothetical protein